MMILNITATATLLILTANLMSGASAQPEDSLRGKVKRQDTNNDAPMTNHKAIRNKAATVALPKTEIELARFYNEDVTIKVDKKTGATIIRANFDMKNYDTPKIPLELVDPKVIKTFEADSVRTGKGPDHLDFTAEPDTIKEFLNTTVTPKTVFGNDDRYTFQDTAYPWSTVGRIVNDQGGSCTGTSIGRRLVLTASHCVNFYGTSVGAVSFTPSYYNGYAPFGVFHAESVIYWKQVTGPTIPRHEIAFDYVVLVMSADVGSMTGYVGYRTYSSSWNGGKYWQNMGYPVDLTDTQRPVFSGNGAINSVDDYTWSSQIGYALGTYIDSDRGQSGGPVWGWWYGESFPCVVADMSAENSSTNYVGGGPGLSSLLDYARTYYS